MLARAMVALTLIDSDLCHKKYLVRIQIQLNHSLFNCLRTKRNNQHLNIFASGVRFLQSFCSFISWRDLFCYFLRHFVYWKSLCFCLPPQILSNSYSIPRNCENSFATSSKVICLLYNLLLKEV